MSQRTKINLMVLLAIAIGAACILYYLAGGQKPEPDAAKKYNTYVKAVVLSAETGETTDQYGRHRGQNIKLRVTSGPDSGKTVETFNPLSAKPQDFDIILAPGDRVIVWADNNNGVIQYYFSDFDRTPYFYILTAVFVASLIFFGRVIGLKSLIGIAISLAVLWQWFLANTLQSGVNVYLLALTFCAVISFLVLLVVGGTSVKTQAAVLGTWGGLALASILSYLSIYFMHLTGIDTEEAFMLKANIVPFLDFHGVLFASMIIGSLGAIIDVTISIASAQYEIYQSSPEIPWKDLYTRGMNVGKDIMGAMSMTLILAYVGGSLPMLLVIAINAQIQFERVLNLPIIITELIRALVGSIGLIYAIPLTALVTAVFLCRKR